MGVKQTDTMNASSNMRTAVFLLAFFVICVAFADNESPDDVVPEAVQPLELAEEQSTAHRSRRRIRWRRSRRKTASKADKKKWAEEQKRIEDIEDDFVDCYGNHPTSNSYTNCGLAKKIADKGLEGVLKDVRAADGHVRAEVWSKAKKAFGIPSNLKCEHSKSCNKLRKAWNGLKKTVNDFANWSKSGQTYVKTHKSPKPSPPPSPISYSHGSTKEKEQKCCASKKKPCRRNPGRAKKCKKKRI